MRLRYRNYDIFEGVWDVFGHGCNCFNVMGAGVAKQVKERYPEAFAVDKKTHLYLNPKRETNLELMGRFSMVRYDDDEPEDKRGKSIYNLYTQHAYNSLERQVEYDAVEMALKRMRWDLMNDNIYYSAKVAFPKIGCGLAGGNWDVVKDIIQDVFHDHENVTIYYL